MNRRQLAVVFALALVVRLVVLAQLREAPFTSFLLGDARIYDEWSRQLAGGDWLGDSAFFQAPLYPYFLALIRALGGDLESARVLQAAIAAGGCALVAGATARMFSPRTGLAAGALSALYAPAIWLDGMIQKTVLALVLSALLLDLLARAARPAAESGSAARRPLFFSAGVVLGLLCLVRENSALLLLPMLPWLAWVPARRRAIGPLLLGLVCVFTPVALRNFAVGDALLPTASNAGVNFYLGNGAEADGLYRPLIHGRGHPAYEEHDARVLAEQAEGRALSPIEVSTHWLRRGIEDVRAAPGRWLRLLGWKAQLLVHRVELMDAESFESHREVSSLLDLLGRLLHAGLLLPLAGLGLILARGKPGLGLLRAAAPVLGAGILLFFVVARFRIAIVPFLIPFAAHGALQILEALRTRVLSRRALVGLGVALTLAIVGNLPLDREPLSRWPWSLEGDPIATTDSNLASEALRRDEPRLARGFAQRAADRDPDSGIAQFNLGLALLQLGEGDASREAFTRAARLEPSFGADVQARLGTLDAIDGNFEAALQELDAATRADPTNGQAHYDRGLVLRRLERPGEAESAYLKAIRWAPTFVDAYHNLGFLLEAQGRWREALERYTQALAIDGDFRLTHEALDRLLAAHPGARDPRR